MEFPPFPGFRPEAFDFLKQLKVNNSRDWFKPRKATFDDEIVWPMRCLLNEASQEAMSQSMNLTSDPKKGIFRIYRDTRFSQNKDPYKTSCGAVLSRDGTTKSFGGVYVHLEPGQCFLAAGFWHPPSDLIRAWRAYMVDHADQFMATHDALAAQDLAINSDEMLKRMPRGYEDYAEAAIAPFLKHKSFTTSRAFEDAEFQGQALVNHLVTMMKDVYPLLEYGWAVERTTITA